MKFLTKLGLGYLIVNNLSLLKRSLIAILIILASEYFFADLTYLAVQTNSQIVTFLLLFRYVVSLSALFWLIWSLSKLSLDMKDRKEKNIKRKRYSEDKDIFEELSDTKKHPKLMTHEDDLYKKH